MPTAKTILYKHKTLADGKHPLMIVVVNNSKAKRFSLGIKLEASEWNFEQNHPRRPKSNNQPALTRFKSIKQRINYINDICDQVLDAFRITGQPFTFEAFKTAFFKLDSAGIKNKADNLFDYYDRLLTELQKDNKVGTADSYSETKKAIIKFVGPNKSISFYDVSVSFLKDFERHLRKNNGTDGGISVRMRNIRAVLNSAIAEKLFKKEYYPFSKHKRDRLYKIPKGEKNPRPMSLKDFEKFKKFNFQEHPHLKADFLISQWIYYTRGINFIDLAKLKTSNIYNKRIIYKRSKSHKTESIKFTAKHEEILSHFSSENFLFPILNENHKTEEQIKNRVKKCRTKFNKSVKEIAKIVGITNTSISSYTFRHQYASILRHRGASIEQISRNMNHGNTKVTEHYLKELGFDEEGDSLDAML